MKDQLRKIQIVLAIFVLVGAGVVGGYLLGYNARPSNQAATAQKANFSTFWNAWDVISNNFYGDTTDQKRVEGAISGMVSSLGDPYTLYLNPQDDKLFRSDLQGSFSGIGVELVQKDGVLTTEGVLDGSPAQKAGIQPKDVITQIDGAKATDLSFADAVDKIRGEKGTTVTLTIMRSGVTNPLTIPVVRDTITVKSVTTDTLGANKDIAYIKMSQFGDDTTALFKAALQDAANSNKKGIIVDLRNNPGGFLTTAADTIGMVLPATITSDQKNLSDRIAVLERDKNGKETPYRATTAAITPDTPIVILVNGNSASASEIFAGALKDYKRATLVGTKTFGKGSVQNLIKLDNGGSIKVTIAKWFTPLGNGIDKKGIDPDVAAELPTGTTPSTSDAQVQKALEVLAGSIK